MSSKSPPEIPGFYFDPEKNRYFKIEKKKVNTPAAQKVVDFQKEKELQAKQEKLQKAAGTATSNKRPNLSNATHTFVQNREAGKSVSKQSVHVALAQKLKFGGFARLDRQLATGCLVDAHPHLPYVLCGGPLTSFSILHLSGDEAPHVEHDGTKSTKSRLDVTSKTYSTQTPVSCLHWSPQQSTPAFSVGMFGSAARPGELLVFGLQDLQQHLGGAQASAAHHPFSPQHLFEPDATTAAPALTSVFRLDRKSLYCSAWSPTSARISIGANKGAHLLDVRTNQSRKILSTKSDVLSQRFLSGSDDVVLNGMRDGSVRECDARAPRHEEARNLTAQVVSLISPPPLVQPFAPRPADWTSLPPRRRVDPAQFLNFTSHRIPSASGLPNHATSRFGDSLKRARGKRKRGSAGGDEPTLETGASSGSGSSGFEPFPTRSTAFVDLTTDSGLAERRRGKEPARFVDLTVSDPFPSPPTPHRSAVCSLHALSNQFYYIAASLDGKVAMWDRRVHRVVLAFEDHPNEHMPFQMCLDEERGLLVSGAQDRMVRVWSLSSGKVVHKMGPFSSMATSVALAQPCNGWLSNGSLWVGTRDGDLFHCGIF